MSAVQVYIHFCDQEGHRIGGTKDRRVQGSSMRFKHIKYRNTKLGIHEIFSEFF